MVFVFEVTVSTSSALLPTLRQIGLSGSFSSLIFKCVSSLLRSSRKSVILFLPGAYGWPLVVATARLNWIMHEAAVQREASCCFLRRADSELLSPVAVSGVKLSARLDG